MYTYKAIGIAYTLFYIPHQERRMIGAWCFFDHFGPLDLKEEG